MNKLKFLDKFSPSTRSVLLIFTLIFIGIIIGYAISAASSPYLIDRIEHGRDGPRPHPSPYKDINLTEEQKQEIIRGYTFSTTILTVEIVLLIGLNSIFFNTYQKIKSKYLIGFILFVGVFLVKSVAQLIFMSPLISEYIRASPQGISPLMGSTIGPFGIFFCVFEIIAICILIFLSRE